MARPGDLIRELVDRGIVLEVCPGSNVILRASEGWASHPIARLRDAGVKVTISTDDPPFFKTNMSYEYQKLSQTFGWEENDFLEMNRTAMNAAFCDDETRARVIKRMEEGQ